MKKLVSLFILFALFIVGCQDDNSILEPINDASTKSLNKGAFVSPIDLVRGDEAIDIHRYIKYTSLKKKLARNYTFDGSVGGQIIQKYTWSSDSDTLKLEAYLTIPEGAYEGELTFELVFDPNELNMELHPTPFYFDKPVELTMKYKGISEDFDIDSENLDFKYYNPDGSFEKVNYDKIEWDPIQRELKVFRAELNHFSRYGWTRTGRINPKDQITIEY